MGVWNWVIQYLVNNEMECKEPLVLGANSKALTIDKGRCYIGERKFNSACTVLNI